MASKDKGGRSTKTAAAKSPKQKKQDKRDKKAGSGGGFIEQTSRTPGSKSR
jgi:hypothetical protein